MGATRSNRHLSLVRIVSLSVHPLLERLSLVPYVAVTPNTMFNHLHTTTLRSATCAA